MGIMPEPNIHELARFYDPDEMHSKVTPETLHIPDHVFFRSSDLKYQKYREAWGASLLARGVLAYFKPCEVRLCEGDFPDFEIRAGEVVHPFEFTEVLEPEYRRGDEYKKERTGPIYSREVKFANVGEAVKWIFEGIKRKAEKRYGPGTHLLVYVDFQVANAIDLALVRKRCKRYETTFKSMWLLFGFGIAQLFPSDEFGTVCLKWSEIPGYLEESKKRMGIKDF